MVLIDFKVVAEAALRFFKIGSGLIEGQRKMIERHLTIHDL